MSTRLYPTFVKGNPQLRIFLPNFFMKLMKPKIGCPSNHVQFLVPLQMTDIDVKNYLEKIYKIPVTQIRTIVSTGDFKKTHKHYLIKEPDYRVAFVTLPEDVTFKFPELFPQAKKDQEDEDHKRLMEQTKDLMKQRRRNWDRSDVPTWFGI